MSIWSGFVLGYVGAAILCAAWWLRGILMARAAGFRHPETSEESTTHIREIHDHHPTLFWVLVAVLVAGIGTFWPIWLVSELRGSKRREK